MSPITRPSIAPGRAGLEEKRSNFGLSLVLADHDRDPPRARGRVRIVALLGGHRPNPVALGAVATQESVRGREPPELVGVEVADLSVTPVPADIEDDEIGRTRDVAAEQ